MRRSDLAVMGITLALPLVCSCGDGSTEPNDEGRRWLLPPWDSLLVAQDWQPACSPDGRRVAYSHVAFEPGFGPSGIYYVDVAADTAVAPHLVVATRSPYGLSFAPDNRRIVYAWNLDIWVTDVLSKETWRLTTQANGQKPCWHPLEDKIVYNRNGPPEDPADSGGIRIVDLATLEDTPVHTRSGRVLYGGGPAWDPRGESVVYTRYVRATQGLEVFRVYPDSSEEIQLTDFGWGCELPKWIGEGDAIVLRIDPGGSRDPDFPDWWTIRANGGRPRPFLDDMDQIEVGSNMAVGPGTGEFVLSRPSADYPHWLALWIVKSQGTAGVGWRQITGTRAGLAAAGRWLRE